MTRITLPLSQEAITITKDVTLSVVRDFLDITGFPVEYTPVLVNELQGESKQLKNFFDICSDDKIRTNYQTYAFYEFTETHAEDDLLANNHRVPITSYTVSDNKRQLYLNPLRHRAVIELTLKMRTMDLTMLNSWLSYFKVASSSQKLTYHIDANYNYAIPQDVIVFMVNSYDRLVAAGSEQTMAEYLAEIVKVGTQTRSNATGTYVDIIGFEKQENCLAMITDISFFNSKEIDEGIYEVSVPIRFEYFKPLAFELDFPVFVANKPIDKYFIEKWVPAIDRKLHPVYKQLWDKGLYSINQLSKYYTGDGGTRLYEYDEFYPVGAYEGTQTLTLFPFSVDLNDKQDVVNIKDLPDDLLPTSVINYISHFQSNGLKFSDSLIVLEIFEIGGEDTRLSHTIDKDLNIRTVGKMDENLMHYCRISIKKDLALLSPKATGLLLDMPKIAFPVLQLFDSTLKATYDYKAYHSVIPNEIPVGRLAGIMSLLLVTEKSINSRSFSIWVKKLNSTSEWLVNIRERFARKALGYGVTSLRR
jgi:hypothetical protein